MKKLIILGTLLPTLPLYSKSTEYQLTKKTTAPVIRVVSEKAVRDLKETTSDITVFNRLAIERSGAIEIKDLLQRLPGVQLQRNGGAGQTTTINMRGTDNRHTLVLIDGVRQEDITSIDGSTRLEFLPLSNVERVEVMKGSQGVLYGASAIGGVINIVTRKKDLSSLQLEAGSFGHKKVAGSFRKPSDDWLYSLDFQVTDVEGYSTRNPVAGTASDDDGLRSQQVRVKARKGGDRYHLSFWTNVSSAVYDYDGTAGDEVGDKGTYRSQDIGGQFVYDHSKSWRSETTVNYNDIERDFSGTTGSSLFRFLYEGRRYRLDHFHTFSLGALTLVSGLEATEEQAMALDSYLDETKKLHRGGVYSNAHFKLRNIIFDSGLRYERMQNAGDRATYKLGARVDLGHFSTRLNLSSGFKAPTLYHYFTAFGANSELRPEKSRTIDATLQYSFSPSSFIKTTFFSTRYDDYINYFSNPTDSNLSRYENLNDVAIDGVESSLAFNLGTLAQVNFNYTFMNTQDKDSGSYLLRRARIQSSADITAFISDTIDTTLAFAYVGRRDDVSSVLPGYSVLHATLRKKLGKSSRVLFKVNNVLDKQYEEVAGFQSDDRNFLLSYSRDF